MATLYELIFNFFYTTIFSYAGEGYGDYDIATPQFSVCKIFSTDGYVDGYMTLQEWLCHTCAIICTLIILTLCCTFVYKIIKLVGGLIR